ncbi:MAG: hypothetical protein QNJ16_11980 [Rhodobacter sp.]|nr:hypothetical protein [Rhodobacter sp.]
MQSVLRFGIAGTALVVAAVAAGAQESNNRVAAHTDWSVFEEPPSCRVAAASIDACPQDQRVPRQCWIVSGPKEVVNKKGDRIVAVDRGEIRLFVSYQPSLNVNGQVSFKSGYPFNEGAVVKLKISETVFDLIARGVDDPGTAGLDESQLAWSKSDDDDARIIAGMKRGSDAVLTGLSKRNTTTIDTFSLFGFTAAVEDAEKRCGT